MIIVARSLADNNLFFQAWRRSVGRKTSLCLISVQYGNSLVVLVNKQQQASKQPTTIEIKLMRESTPTTLLPAPNKNNGDTTTKP